MVGLEDDGGDTAGDETPTAELAAPAEESPAAETADAAVDPAQPAEPAAAVEVAAEKPAEQPAESPAESPATAEQQQTEFDAADPGTEQAQPSAESKPVESNPTAEQPASPPAERASDQGQVGSQAQLPARKKRPEKIIFQPKAAAATAPKTTAAAGGGARPAGRGRGGRTGGALLAQRELASVVGSPQAPAGTPPGAQISLGRIGILNLHRAVP